MANIGRASAFIAAGTLVSRVTGLVRTMVLTLAIGAAATGDAFQIANGLPQAIYALVSAGLLTAIVVPQIVKAAQHSDGGSAFISKLFTLGLAGLFTITLIAMAAVPLLVSIWAPGYSGAQRELTIALAYWLVPQLFFYGAFALIGETLNARNIYGPYTWAPVINNIVSTAGFVLIIVMFGANLVDIESWTPDRVALLGGSATLGIIAQCIVLAMFWGKTKIALRPDFKWRGVGLGAVAKLAGWTFLMVLTTTIAGIIQSVVVTEASRGGEPAQAVMNNTWLLYMLPYSLIVLSIGTPFFTRMSEEGAAGETEKLRGSIDSSIRTLGVFIVAATAAVAAGSVPAVRIFLGGSESFTAADAAPVLLAYLVNLIPVAILFVVQRMFYILGDTKTPFFFTLLQASIIVVSTLLCNAFLPIEWLAAGVALMQSLATIIQLVVATILLQRKFGSIRMSSWLPAYVRFMIAGLVAGLAGWSVYLLSGGETGWMLSGGQLIAVVGLGVVGLVTVIIYIVMLAIVRAPELAVATDMIKRFRRRSAE